MQTVIRLNYDKRQLEYYDSLGGVSLLAVLVGLAAAEDVVHASTWQHCEGRDCRPNHSKEYQQWRARRVEQGEGVKVCPRRQWRTPPSVPQPATTPLALDRSTACADRMAAAGKRRWGQEPPAGRARGGVQGTPREEQRAAAGRHTAGVAHGAWGQAAPQGQQAIPGR